MSGPDTKRYRRESGRASRVAPEATAGRRPPEVALDRVTKRATDDRLLVDGVSFTVDANSHVAVVGRAGSGKTSVLQMIAGLAIPDEGCVLVDGASISVLDYEELRQHRLETGFVFGDKGLLANASLFENVALPLRYHFGMVLGEQAIRDRVESMLEELRIEAFAGIVPWRATSSVRKRAMLARALLLEPALLVFDEPQTGLVIAEQELVRDACERRRKSRGMTIIQADHDGTFGPFKPERVVVIEAGHVKAVGSPDEVRGAI